jgi:hypothetical protein
MRNLPDLPDGDEWEMPEERPGDNTKPRRRGRKLVFVVLAILGIAAVFGLYAALVPTPSQPTPRQRTMQFLEARGLADFLAAGVTGNLDYESHLNGAAVQAGNGPGRGIAMWDVNGPVWQAVQATANQAHQPVTDLTVQLEVLWADLNTRHADVLDQLKHAANYQAATGAFAMLYLQPAHAATPDNLSQRFVYAKQALDATS